MNYKLQFQRLTGKISFEGSAESESNTSRGSSKPKRPTWDMSTPHGDLLNQPGVGFIVAGQNKVRPEY